MSKELSIFSPFLSFLLIFSLSCPLIFAQSPALAPALAPAPPLALALAPAPAPAPPPTPNIIAILKKAGHFNTLIRLIKKTNMDDRIFSLLKDSNPITIFAPTDEAFSDLKSNTLKALTSEQRIQLVQFHIVNSLLSFSDFQTVSNPLSTQAGDNSKNKYPVNVTVSETNKVNITTGIVNATVTDTVYSDNQLEVFAVDKVLLPLRFFPRPPPPPPPEELPSLSTNEDAPKPSGVMPVLHHGVSAVSLVGSAVAAFYLCV